jgi:hypothetical protein
MKLTRFTAIHHTLSGYRPVDDTSLLVYSEIDVPTFDGDNNSVGRFGSGFRQPSEGDSCRETAFGWGFYSVSGHGLF